MNLEIDKTALSVLCAIVFWGSLILPQNGLAQTETAKPAVKKPVAEKQADKKADAKKTKGSSAKPATKKSKKSKPDQEEQEVEGITFSDPVTSKWKVGTRIIGGASPAQNVLITIPVPNDWPEQSVAFDDVDVKSTSRVVDDFRMLEPGIRQLVVKMPRLGAREEVIVSVTCAVTTKQINAPVDKSVFVKGKTNHRQGKVFLGVGPDINFRNSKLKKEVKNIVKDKQSVWEEGEALFDWVRDNIEDVVQEPSDVVQVFRHRKGCNEDKVGLFVAMCRANKVPARMVWVEGTQFAEFMLVDANKKAHWFPCRPGGLREFGEITEPRVILQKGDSIRVPEKEQRQKFVAEYVTCEGRGKSAKPTVRFFRELLPEDE